MSTRIKLMVVLSMMGACDWSAVEVDRRAYACTSDADCGSGWSCEASVCVSLQTAAGGRADSGIGGGAGGGGGSAGGSASSDSGLTDAGLDGGLNDPLDGGNDAGGVDAGGVDAGGVDAGGVDAGGVDAGEVDAGEVDAGGVDAGGVDAGRIDGGFDGGPRSLRLTMNLHRDGGTIIAELFAFDARDGGLTGLTVQLIAGGVSRTVTDLGAGRYVSTVAPTSPSGEVRFVASVPSFDAGASRTAVVLPAIDPQWDQPESVGGLVNTAGTEDSPTVSPDGQWLIVGIASPIDRLSCIFGLGTGPADGRNSACQNSLGPVSGPARPRMPGASRVISPTRILQNAPSLCLSASDGGDVSLPLMDGGATVLNLSPSTAYGFRRQPDGTFAEPFVLQFQSDGVGSPFCFTFLSSPVANVASLLYANKPINQTSTVTRPWLAEVTLGADVSLGSYSCAFGNTTFVANNAFPLTISPATQEAGNTTFARGATSDFLISDDESVAPSFTIGARALSDGGFEPWQPMELPEPGDERRHPVLEGGRIYYFRNSTISSTPWLSMGMTRASFGTPRVELQPEPLTGGLLGVPPGRILGIGQPTFAHLPDGTVEMYFVYYVRTATGFDAQIARVRRR